MHEAVPPGKPGLTRAESRRLSTLTQALLASKPDAQEEYGRFLSAARKNIGLPAPVPAEAVQGKRIMVTGGTGCIGSALMTQLARFSPSRLISVSRGVTQQWPRLPEADYLHLDIRHAGQLAALFDQARCDVVFHVAGQRDPGLAEQEVHRTVTTNVLGTANVLDAAAGAGVPRVVFASTGKAFRPYSPEVYTASKRVAEWLMWRTVSHGLATCSVARFTHVIDNSIIHNRLLDWCDGGVIRLHGTDIAFYVQSARQSAQLLLAAQAGAEPGALQVHAISDLGWPVALLDVALGVLANTSSRAPIYFSGYDSGYEATPFPALYDPLTAGDVSPLISAFEATGAGRSWCPAVDAFPLQLACTAEPEDLMRELADTCSRTTEPGPVRTALDELSWSLFDATLQAVPRPVLNRAAQISAPHRGRLSAGQSRMLTSIGQYAAGASPVSPAGIQPAVPSMLSNVRRD